MNNKQLQEIFENLVHNLEGKDGHWEFTLGDVHCICLTDELHNRMRVMAAIKEHADMSLDEYKRCMEANFHSVLDIKYAVSGNILLAVFMHPLQELTAQQVEDALQQVYSAVMTYGTTYSSSNLYFPTDDDRRSQMN